MKITTILASSMILLGLANCYQRLTDFTVISSKNVDLSRASDFKRGKDRVIGKDLKHIIIFIPTGRPDAKEALDKAIETTPGAVALADGAITSHWWYIPYIYGRQWFEVEGTPLIDQKLLKEIAQ